MIFDPKTFWSKKLLEKILGRKNVGRKTNLDKKKIRVQKNLRPKKFGEKNYGFEKIYV